MEDLVRVGRSGSQSALDHLQSVPIGTGAAHYSAKQDETKRDHQVWRDMRAMGVAPAPIRLSVTINAGTRAFRSGDGG